MAVSKVIYKSSPQATGETWIDATTATATAADILAPKTAMLADGVMTTGTGTGGGGGSSWTLLGTSEFTVSTTSTSSAQVGTIQLAAAWTDAKIIYIRVRDKAGKRASHFFGWDGFCLNFKIANSDTTSIVAFARILTRVGTAAQGTPYQQAASSYGVYAQSIDSDGTIHIYSLYSSTNSYTIDGTFKVDVYALDWPDGVSPFV